MREDRGDMKTPNRVDAYAKALAHFNALHQICKDDPANPLMVRAAKRDAAKAAGYVVSGTDARSYTISDTPVYKRAEP